MTNYSLLRNRLDEWKLSNLSNGQESALALKILETAEKVVKTIYEKKIQKEIWYDFLFVTRKPAYLLALGERNLLLRWSEVVFKAIQVVEFSLLNLLEQRVGEHPKHILFQDMSTSIQANWSYEQVLRHLKEIATVFHLTAPEKPHVAIYCENSVEGACCDLACLCFDIFDTPLNTHFNKETLQFIIEDLKINIIVTDTKERLKKLMELKAEFNLNFKIFTIYNEHAVNNESQFLGERCKQLDNTEIELVIEKRVRRPINQVATTMFTSGSTGQPKGVSFSIYNLVSKRFARGAALPTVGDNEVMLCFLPLFHTFGRYLEMMGSIYWGGTYVFAGNPSVETLLALFPKVNPTAFISIPLRWLNLYERCVELFGVQPNEELKQKFFREVVGTRLRWGLSAAGYLDPKVFRFFHGFNVRLSSGFGMTEATGGITMTPSLEYIDNSVGIPLPGVHTRLRENRELEMTGHYIARYLEDAGPDDLIPYPVELDTDFWVGTGDIFTINALGFHEIIDRVKDIYKNNKGQTIAPQVVEKKFTGVPGIKRTFLVGDARPYNVLLIVPDTEDSFLASTTKENSVDYFHQIVMAGNKDIAPYERVVNFAVLERDFSVEKEELTAKGTYNRKTIEKNFEETVKSLYISNTVVLENNNVSVSIPRWFFRDLGILETDIVINEKGLYNRRTQITLVFKRTSEGSYVIGDLEYVTNLKTIDVGQFARQPRLWIGNPSLIAFSPVKDGWDLPLGDISERVFYPRNMLLTYHLTNFPVIKGLNDQKLIFVNNLISTAMYSELDLALKAIQQLGQLFTEYDVRIGDVMRRRLEALAVHPEEKVRAMAYRTLLLDETNPDYSKSFPAFVQSGLSFLNEESIKEIASKNFGKRQLEAFRQRLYAYRVQLHWPVDNVTRKSFENILKLLFNLASGHLEYFISVRSELASWILHRSDPQLAEYAEKAFHDLDEIFKKQLADKAPKYDNEFWKQKLVFETVISDKEIERITGTLKNTNFLIESVILAFNELDFTLNEISNSGIWITRLQSYKDYRHYRLSINTNTGKHFDLHLVASQNLDETPDPDTVYWLTSIAGYAYGLPTLPNLGCSIPEEGFLSTQYIGALSVWDKIREFSDIHKSAGQLIKPAIWRKLFIKAFATFFKAWHNSGFHIVPGSVSANNVVVPELDFRENATIVTLSGWKHYDNTLSLIAPMIQDFYCKTAALYPWSKKQLDVNWIFDACIEAIGIEKAKEFFANLEVDLRISPIHYFDNLYLVDNLDKYLEIISKHYYLPLVLFNAISQYKEWEIINPMSTSEAKEQTIFELLVLYKLHRYPDMVRYHFYRNTYFADASAQLKEVFDNLLAKMDENVEVVSIQLIELSDLQAAITTAQDKRVFSKMVFPKIHKEQRVDLMKIGESKKEQLIVRSYLKDKKDSTYIFREPLNPSEVGQLYQLFYKENYPKDISKHDRHFVITDAQETVIGGLCYKILDNNIVLLDGSVVISPLQGNGLGSAMIEDFFIRMASQGIKVIKAHFLFGNYYLKHNFKVDKHWGALVKYL